MPRLYAVANEGLMVVRMVSPEGALSCDMDPIALIDACHRMTALAEAEYERIQRGREVDEGS